MARVGAGRWGSAAVVAGLEQPAATGCLVYLRTPRFEPGDGAGRGSRFLCLRCAQDSAAALGHDLPRHHPAHLFQRRADAPVAGRQARRRRQRAGGRAGGGHALLLLFGRAALHRLCRGRRAPRRDLLVSDCRAHGQRGGAGHALRYVRLAGGAALHGHWAAHRHPGRYGHRSRAARRKRGRRFCLATGRG